MKDSSDDTRQGQKCVSRYFYKNLLAVPGDLMLYSIFSNPGISSSCINKELLMDSVHQHHFSFREYGVVELRPCLPCVWIFWHIWYITSLYYKIWNTYAYSFVCLYF